MKKIFHLLSRSMRSEEYDFTRGALGDAVILLAIPMILELALEGVFAVVDMYFVSKLGPNAIATVGLTEAAVTIVYSIAIGLSTGATAVIARRVGEKDHEGASRASAQSLILALGISILLGIIGVIFAQDILRGMGASPEVVTSGYRFTQIILGGDVAIILLFLINGIFRGAGDAAIAMRSLWVASGVNIILCPFMIHFFCLPGAAVATVIGRSSGVLYQLNHLRRKSNSIELQWAHFRLDFPQLASLTKISWPAALQYIIGSGSWIILTRLVAEAGGTAASAGYQIAFRNFVFFILPAWGLSNAAATLVGQNLGAKLPDRAYQSVIKTSQYSLVLMTFFTFIFVGFGHFILPLYSQDTEVLAYGLEAMRGIGLGFIFYGIGMVLTQALNGAGDTKSPTWINFLCFWIFQTPLAYFLQSTSLGVRGVIYAIPISHALLAVVAWIIFQRGKWKTMQI